MGRGVADLDTYTERTQAIETRRLFEIAAAHAMAHRGEDRCDRAHTGATDAHDVDARGRRQIDRLGGCGGMAVDTVAPRYVVHGRPSW